MIADMKAPLADLLQRVGCGDEPALSDLQHHTRTWLTCSIRRIVKDPRHGEEVLQDVYTYVWQHASEYRNDRGTPWAWLAMLARSRALDRLRLTRRESKVVEFDDRVRPILPAGCSREPVEMWQGFVLQAGLRELSSDQRRLVRMAFFDGFSHSEIAEKTDMPLGTVKTRIRAALLRLRGVLMKKELPRES